MKRCTDCGDEKPISNFRIRKNYNGSETVVRNLICNKCLSNRMTEWRKKNTERYREYQNEYSRKDRKKNPEKYHKKWAKQYYKDVEKSRLAQRLKRQRRKQEKNNQHQI